MTTAQKYDIELDQGATFVLQLVYKDGSGATIDLTGYSAHMQIREEVGGKVYATANTSGNRIVLGADGSIVVTIPHSETSKIDIERGIYDLFLAEPFGAPVLKILYGDVAVNPSVSRP